LNAVIYQNINRKEGSGDGIGRKPQKILILDFDFFASQISLRSLRLCVEFFLVSAVPRCVIGFRLRRV
jgi:hypothetical protein